MALVGKELGKDVGQWFRPSTSAGAIKYVDVAIFAAYMLTSLSDPWCKAPRCIARHLCHSRRPDLPDGCVFGITRSLRHRKLSRLGRRVVVVLIGIWLGVDSVNPIYYEITKVCDSWILLIIHVRSI